MTAKILVVDLARLSRTSSCCATAAFRLTTAIWRIPAVHRPKPEGRLMMMWTALPALPQHDLRVSRKESGDEAGHDDWIGYREVRFSGARCRRGGTGGFATEIVPKPSARVLCQTAAMPDWYRGLRLVTLLGP